MRETDRIAYEVALYRLQEVNELLDGTDAGICLIHLEACIAALECQLAGRPISVSERRQAKTMGMLPHDQSIVSQVD